MSPLAPPYQVSLDSQAHEGKPSLTELSKPFLISPDRLFREPPALCDHPDHAHLSFILFSTFLLSSLSLSYYLVCVRRKAQGDALALSSPS